MLLLNINELRRGNLVGIASFMDFKIGVVLEIRREYILVERKAEIHSSKNHRIIPIELTEEWLNKLGFCRYENSPNKFLSPRVDGLRLMIRMDMFVSNRFFFIMNQNWAIDIKSVHHLQNVFFSLTGEELKLNN